MIRDIALAHGDDPALLEHLRPYQLRALEAIATCGTPAAGMHAAVCDACDTIHMVPNTCGNRSCPHCQGRERAQWVANRRAELLPCDYFHVVFTLPPELRSLTSAFPQTVLGCMMRAAGDAVDYLCRDPRHLGAEVGQMAVLHTWRRDLGWHPHVHLIVTDGGWNAAQQRWITAHRYGPDRCPFLLPVETLQAAFQRRLRRLLLRAYHQQDFASPPPHLTSRLSSVDRFTACLNAAIARPWVIRIEPPFGGPDAVLKYLGAYVNRVACSPARITAHDPQAGTVTYTWRTNADPHHLHSATIPATDFLTRFAQHILPPRFHRIRFRGLWATAYRATKLHVVQRALGITTPPEPLPLTPPPPVPCPCGQGFLRRLPGTTSRLSPAQRRRILSEIRHMIRQRTDAHRTQHRNDHSPQEAACCA